jgi:hypothetical protein
MIHPNMHNFGVHEHPVPARSARKRYLTSTLQVPCCSLDELQILAGTTTVQHLYFLWFFKVAPI